MKTSYTVTLIPKKKYKRKIVYRGVYDIGHYYSRNLPDAYETLRLLIGDQFGTEPCERVYINLMNNDVLIHMDDVVDK